ncbi:dephospho-CoA kinase [Alicyclobacillus tolerans]|uniref:Dephospho-CoA kinase n=1 Tax=Alicyclobacillus tolerans TaxID=90970 RepID=A0ABT9LUJ1_9BACL|nr:dephospho-CoA kinase [Alicyclobacillus tengchongensis]MDP9727936.1 dephospho-CoA kinase [Alicyclobacillus tengchongensis]
MIIGLTGGIASGKSTVSAMFRELGAYVVDADIWARRVVSPGSSGWKEIVDFFGREILTEDGELNRPKLAELIFHHPDYRHRLNAITHPKIRIGMKEETEDYLKQYPGQPVIWDVPLLFEGETHQLVDETVLVYVPYDIQLERLMKRNQLSEEEAKARIASQMPLDSKRKLADYLIDNSLTLEHTREQVQSIWRTIQQNACQE